MRRPRWLKSIKNKTFQSTHSITECDPRNKWRTRSSKRHFNPRTPLQSATWLFRSIVRWLADISIHALHYRVRPFPQGDAINGPEISIHALHYRVRLDIEWYIVSSSKISIHALHYRVRQHLARCAGRHLAHFNPRTPLQSATI